MLSVATPIKKAKLSKPIRRVINVLNRNVPSGFFFSVKRMGLSVHGPPGPAWDGAVAGQGRKGHRRARHADLLSFGSLWSGCQCPAPPMSFFLRLSPRPGAGPRLAGPAGIAKETCGLACPLSPGSASPLRPSMSNVTFAPKTSRGANFDHVG
jgi:hypothetical protein